MAQAQPTTRSILAILTKARIADVGRQHGVALDPSATKDGLVDSLLDTRLVRFQRLLSWMGRDELKVACRAHGLDDSGRARDELMARLLEAHGLADSVPPKPLFAAHEIPRYAPRPGDIVQARHRQYLVEEVVARPEDNHATLVRLVCLDDDDQGRALDVLWELELGARVMQPETHGLGNLTSLDPPRHFAAYLHALKWSSVTATDARLFQSPFRAGIRVMNHQLTPLEKALSLPRANLFIADDVGLGKTIEAGLVLQELLLRQRVDFTLIVAPASVCLQWRDEMEKKFGLRFEVMNRHFITRRQKERGFGVNPWTTHNRFIVSYPTLRRPEYRDPLLAHVGGRIHKSLLVLDEAHTAAPASASKYATDSSITRVVRDIAPRFENRLFLSATPHNGHSNSFSALLEILDPQRFTRGVKITSKDELAPVMVRRLKSDLADMAGTHFPRRKVVRIEVGLEDDPTELALARMLAEYTNLMRPEKGRGQLVFINLQKRLLSSVEAFHRTLQLHARAVGEGRAAAALQLDLSKQTEDEDEHGPDDDALDAREAAEAGTVSRLLQSPEGRARTLLDDMLRASERHRHAPDQKVLALVDWIRRHQCPAVRIGGADRTKATQWTDRRVIVFTEYGDTKRYLTQLLTAALDGTDDADRRILPFHGGMSDEQREEVQRAFNSPPGAHPVRILIATDAAREGVNLQGHCADLFHFDIPWNPARMEQRNGRIDRTLQFADEVRCHYFVYPKRQEDVVLEKLVKKVDTIQRELGSLGAVVMDRMTDVMERGIDRATGALLDEAAELGGRREVTATELERVREDRARIAEEIDEAGRILEASRRITDFESQLLRDAIDVGLELAGASPLAPTKTPDAAEAYAVPDLPDAWQHTVDTLRPPRDRNEPFWEWRKRPAQPVVFDPPPRMNSALVQLHLSHPFVRRILSRFLAQGYSANDLSRVTVVKNPHDSLVRVIAFGRLSLFGPGAARLHDQLVSVAAQWLETKGDRHLKPFADEADKKAIDRLESLLSQSPTLDPISPKVRERLLASAPTDFATLWPHVRAEADALAHDLEQKLEARGRAESEALRTILESQSNSIERTLGEQAQLAIDFTDGERDQRDQYEQDQKHLRRRLAAIATEIDTEPPQISALYQTALRRLEPVGMVYLWPETRG